MDLIVFFGLLAGFLQLTGYVLYYTHVVKSEGKPNPLTWLMFAYGTVLLTIMEFDTMVREAKALGNEALMWAVLMLPITCSTGGVLVATRIWWNNYKATKDWWPSAWRIDWKDSDGKAFATDLGMTVGYLVLWTFTLWGDTTDTEHKWWVIGFLLVSNATTIPNFIPILRSTLKSPEDEHPLPWYVWAIAYTILIYPTWMKYSVGVEMPTSWSPFLWDVTFYEFMAIMCYPVLNAVLHGLQGMAAFSPKQNNFLPRHRFA